MCVDMIPTRLNARMHSGGFSASVFCLLDRVVELFVTLITNVVNTEYGRK